MRIYGNDLIGLRIAKIRKLNKLTQAEFAERIDLSPTEISNIERGKNSISFNTLVNICNEFDVCPCQILSGAIKDEIDNNIVDLIRELNKEEQKIVYKLLLAYLDR
ncbi:MAG: helix-turn-helix transcriptional regulator [Clostridia bacterium]|nr:helix-turn-helix transcriptional regulator [Clostridia bacterium]